MGILEGKKVLITGVLTEASIAFSAARLAQEQGAEVLHSSFGRMLPITTDPLLMLLSDDSFSPPLNPNLPGVFRVVKRVTKSMLRAKYGRVVLIGSVVGLLGSAGQVNYSAAKSALVGMARSITRELGGKNITANVVAPGFIDTDMTAELGEDLAAKYRSQIPAGRFASPEEVAKVVAWVASEDASYISGAVIPVDGGLGMGH